jgi:hypothetical protein
LIEPTNKAKLLLPLDLIMKLTLYVISVFLLIVAIGAPPVVEKATKDKADKDAKTDESDEVVGESSWTWRSSSIHSILVK